MPTVIHVDLETFSCCDLKSCGGHRYAADPSTEILCVGLALNDEEPVIWLPEDFCFFTSWYPMEEHEEAWRILNKLSAPDTLCYAHNATGFEVPHFDLLFEKQTGFKPPAHHQWRCTAAMARRAALPPSLEKCAEALKLSQKKDTRGKALIRKFCIPQKDGRRILPSDEPDAFKELCEYCRQDVRTERAVHKALSHFELTGFALETFQADLDLNCRGFPVNLAALHRAKSLVDSVMADAEVQFKECTGLNTTQGVKFLQWLKDRGYPADDLRAETMDEQIEDAAFDPASEVGRALLLRQKVSFAAVKKIDSMIKCAGPHDNRVRGTLTYYGANTGRWSGSLVQPQNFKRPTIKHTELAYADIMAGAGVDHIDFVYGPVLETVSSCIRHFIHDTKPFFNADYAAIEGRIVCWLAGQEDALEEYRQGIDRYVRMASIIFNKPESQINKHPERFVGKQAILLLGFQGGGPKFRSTCEKFGYKDLAEGLEHTTVKAYRTKHDKVVQYWYDCQEAAVKAIQAPGQKFKVRNVCFFVAGTAGIRYLFAVLPSGRKLAYPHVKLEPTLRWTECDEKHQVINPSWQQFKHAQDVDPEGWAKNESITYWGQIPSKSTWGRITTYGGKLVENCLASGTKVKTHRGWVQIQSIQPDDLIWDGVEFVIHGGLVAKGEQEVIDVHGVWATPDHLFLTTNGWQPAERVCTFGRNMFTYYFNEHRQNFSLQSTPKDPTQFVGAKIWAFNCGGVCHQRYQKNSVEGGVSVRQNRTEGRFGTKTTRTQRVWASMSTDAQSHSSGARNSWHVQPSSVRSVAFHETTVLRSQSPSIPQLWCPWNNRVCKMAKQLRELLVRHGTHLAKRVGYRSHQQRRQLRARQLSVGNSEREQPQSQGFNSSRVGTGCSRPEWYRQECSVLATQTGGETGGGLHTPTRSFKKVYDIRNCGPRNRFTVLGRGLDLIAHNCTQAVAADIMAHGTINAARKGYRAVMLVHDESVCQWHDGGSVEEFIECLTDLPPWADGLPIEAEGSILPFYSK